MANVGVCTPNWEFVRPDYYRAFYAMQHQFLQHQFTHLEVDTQIVGLARNILANSTMGLDQDVLWFIDSDILIPPHAGVLVDQALQLGAVGALYFNRRIPHTPQVYTRATEEDGPQNHGAYWPKVEYPEEGISPEEAVGLGCMVIRIDVFEKLQEYWQPMFDEAASCIRDHPDFRKDSALDDIATIVERLSPWFEFLTRKGEDFYFSDRCHRAGIELHINYDVKCLHLGNFPIGEENFRYLYDQGMIQPEPTIGVPELETQVVDPGEDGEVEL